MESELFHYSVYCSAINVGSLTMSKTTDYIGAMIYENGTLKRILINGGYIEGGVYHYYLTDHQGNNRLVADAGGTVVQKNHYYPFGTAFAETPVAEQGKQPYKYNAKELDQMHGLNLYDYSARLMDPALGRFHMVDPLAYKYYSISPYAYCLNNPVRFVDPDGRKIVGTNGKPVTYTENTGWSKNTPIAVRSIGDAMMKTNKGTERLNVMLKSNVAITMKLSPEMKIEEKGLKLGVVSNLKYVKGKDGNIDVKSLDLTIYKGSIADLANPNGKYVYDIADGLNMDEIIGAIAGHESEHTEEDNLQQQYENDNKGANHDVENKPLQTEREIVDEILRNKK